MRKEVIALVVITATGCGGPIDQSEPETVASAAQGLSKESVLPTLVHDPSIQAKQLRSSLRMKRSESGHVSSMEAKDANRTWPWGGGDVYWQISGAYYAGYSVLPENSGSLAYPGGYGSSQEVDGLYNRGWGCYHALKIPDDCVAIVYSTTIQWGCDLYPAHSVSFVTPGSGNESAWPVCPG